jgi:hypothetical protein
VTNVRSRSTFSSVGRKLRGHWSSTAVARRIRAHASVRSHAASTGGVHRNDPTCPWCSAGRPRFMRRYVGLAESWVITCQAFMVNSNRGGTWSRHRCSTRSGGGS